MEGKILFAYCCALLLSLVMSMAAVYSTMQVLKIDASTSAVGQEGATRGDNLRKLMLFGMLAPIGTAFATGFSFINNSSPWFIALAFFFTVLQTVSVVYMATSVAETPVRTDNVTMLSKGGT